jgi:hypothetical protein
MLARSHIVWANHDDEITDRHNEACLTRSGFLCHSDVRGEGEECFTLRFLVSSHMNVSVVISINTDI